MQPDTKKHTNDIEQTEKTITATNPIIVAKTMKYFRKYRIVSNNIKSNLLNVDPAREVSNYHNIPETVISKFPVLQVNEQKRNKYVKKTVLCLEKNTHLLNGLFTKYDNYMVCNYHQCTTSTEYIHDRTCAINTENAEKCTCTCTCTIRDNFEHFICKVIWLLDRTILSEFLVKNSDCQTIFLNIIRNANLNSQCWNEYMFFRCLMPQTHLISFDAIRGLCYWGGYGFNLWIDEEISTIISEIDIPKDKLKKLISPALKNGYIKLICTLHSINVDINYNLAKIIKRAFIGNNFKLAHIAKMVELGMNLSDHAHHVLINYTLKSEKYIKICNILKHTPTEKDFNYLIKWVGFLDQFEKILNPKPEFINILNFFKKSGMRFKKEKLVMVFIKYQWYDLLEKYEIDLHSLSQDTVNELYRELLGEFEYDAIRYLKDNAIYHTDANIFISMQSDDHSTEIYSLIKQTFREEQTA